MRVHDQPAFVLHARAYRETSMLLEVLTRGHGRLGLVARGVRRERSRLPRGLLQPLQPLRIGFVLRGELGTLTGAEPAPAARLRGDALIAGIYVNELVSRLTGRADPHARLFDAYADCIGRLAGSHGDGVREPGAADARDAAGWTLRRFERDLLAELGYALPLRRVAGSNRAVESGATYAYDPEAGPLDAPPSRAALRVRGSALLALADDVRPASADLEQLRRLMRAVIRHHLGGADLRAWSLVAGSGARAPGAREPGFDPRD